MSETLLFLAIIFLWIYAVKNRTRIEKTEADVKRLAETLRDRTIKNTPPAVGATTAPTDDVVPPATPVPAASPIPPAPDSVWADEQNEDIWVEVPPTPPSTVKAAQTVHMAKPSVHMAAQTAAPTQKTVPKKDDDDFEFRFGKSLPVWIGGVALALSGFYLVKYSIENGLLTASVRVALGFAFGLALLAAGAFIRNKRADMADSLRISQALSGAGLAVLYGTFFAATRFYGMPAGVGFGGMAGVTVLAVLLSLRHGMPIAALGMLGGFATPALLANGTHDAMNLFVYLFLLTAGMFTLIRNRDWWVLAVPTLLLSFFWTFGWILSGNIATDALWPALFLLAIASTALFTPAQFEKNAQADEQDWNLIAGYIATGGALTLMAVLTVKSGFGLMEWGMYGVLGAGALILSWLKPAQYRYAPWVSMAITAFMIMSWHASNDVMTATILGFGLMYGLGGLFFVSRNPSLAHGGTLSAASLGFYALGYLSTNGHIYDILPDVITVENVRSAQVGNILSAQPHFWSVLAIVLAAFFTFMTAHHHQKRGIADAVREKLRALFALMATAFVFIGLVMETHKGFMPVATVLELAAVCWVYTRVNIPFLRQIAALLFYVFCVLMAPQLFDLLGAVIDSVFKADAAGDAAPLMAAAPLFRLLLPAAALALSSWLLNRKHDSRLAEMLEASCVALGALACYYLLRHAFHAPQKWYGQEAGYVERGLVTNTFFALALCTVYGGRLWARRALLWSGSALFALALFRTGYFEYVLYNPLWESRQSIAGGVIFNSLLVTYGLPLFWLWLEERPALRIYVAPAAKGAAVLILVFTLITLEVRQAYHGAHLMLGQEMTNAEIYSYSAAWLVLSAGMLFVGTLFRHKPLRVAALVVMMLTACKVFLYDAGELEGLYRVFAFMGLGLTLIALSWFYTRFVLNDAQQK